MESFKKNFSVSSLRAYYAEFAGMVFFLGISVGSACSAFKVVSEYSTGFLKVCCSSHLARVLRFNPKLAMQRLAYGLLCNILFTSLCSEW